MTTHPVTFEIPEKTLLAVKTDYELSRISSEGTSIFKPKKHYNTIFYSGNRGFRRDTSYLDIPPTAP
jgi:hypothetical protein